MRTQEYILQGKDVPAKFRGLKVNLRVAETLEETSKLSESPVDLFNDAYVIYQQGKMRREAGKENVTAEQLGTVASTIVHKRTTPGTPKTAKPQTKVRSQAAASGNRMFERALGDENYLRAGIAGGFIDEAEFTAWRTAREEAAKAKAAEAQGGNGQASTTTPASTPAQQPNVQRRPAGAGGGKR